MSIAKKKTPTTIAWTKKSRRAIKPATNAAAKGASIHAIATPSSAARGALAMWLLSASGSDRLVPGGIFAQPTNIGTQTHNHFCYSPEINANLLYNINSNWRAMVGYSFIYWNQVVLAGNQIDRNVNLGQATGGPQVPLPKFQRSDFWVQGISLGGDYRW